MRSTARPIRDWSSTLGRPLEPCRNCCLSGLMRFEEGMNLAHREWDSLLRFFPREQAHFGLGREHGALHGDGVRVRGDLVGQDQDWVLATTHEIACDGEEEVGIGCE